MYGRKFGGNFGGGAASVSRREKLVEERSFSVFFVPFKFLPPLLARAGGFDAKIFPELAQVISVRLHLHYGPLSATSFPGFSPTRPTERVGENPGNEVALSVLSNTRGRGVRLYRP